jgi:hypothetical protein
LRRIFNEIASGHLLFLICREKWAPSESVFYRWMASDPKLRASYQMAKVLRIEVLQDQIYELAGADFGRLRHQIKTRQWLNDRLARYAPKED